MTTIHDLIVRSARDLNDYTDHSPNKQFQRWSEEQLMGYWNEAMCVMYSLNPSKFKCAKVAKLKPGINQVFEGCEKVLSIVGVCDEDGNVLYEVERDKGDKKLKWGGYRPRHCATPFQHSRDFKLTSYRIATDKDGSLFVSPRDLYRSLADFASCSNLPAIVKAWGISPTPHHTLNMNWCFVIPNVCSNFYTSSYFT